MDFHDSMQVSEIYLEPNWVSEVDVFVKLLTVFNKSFTFDVWVGSEYDYLSFHNWILKKDWRLNKDTDKEMMK